MSFIFLGVGNDGQDMWGMLKAPSVNEVWKITGEKGDIPRLHKIGTRPGLPPASVEGDRYDGPIPSESICQFFNFQKDKMKYFDDGERMVPGKKSRWVEVDNAIPEHPITYPPAPFTFDGVTFVIRKGLSGSKYT